jgi:L-alanine-DL-glutamate epimerase-like enolase superfamily enzyme
MPVAGGEMAYGVELFRRLFDGGSLDIAMPDLKYCGGAGEAAAVGHEHESRHPASVSIHSPSGPASLLASAHATAAFNGARPLEHAIEEVSWRAMVLEPPERVESGALVIPQSPGLGAGLNPAFIADHGRRWTP